MVSFIFEEAKDEKTAELAQLALDARNNSHCPYSKFRVGAALRTTSGQCFKGCNIESCSYSPTICAERVAVASAVAAGFKNFEAIAISSDQMDEPTTPCGVCRQFMREFSKDLTILLVRPNGRVCQTDLSVLLPGSFGPQSLAGDNQYYVGYVEDDESVDAIMKKFEELERIEKEYSSRKKPDTEAESSAKPHESDSSAESKGEDSASKKKASDDNDAGDDSIDEDIAAALEISKNTASNNGDGEGMSMELLEEVFKRTSAFTVRGATMDDIDLETMDDIELWQAEAGGDIPSEWEEEEDYVSLNLDDDMLDDEFGVVLPRRRYMKRDPSKKSTGPRLTSRDQIIQRYKYMQVRVQDRHGHTFFVSRKVNAVDPSMPTYVRIPPDPIPRSWVKHIRPLAKDTESTTKNIVSGVLIPKTEPKRSRLINTDVTLDFDFSIFKPTFQCVYMDPPLLLPDEEPKPGFFDISKLVAIPVDKLLAPGSFLFTWCEKELIVDMCEMAENNWGLKYVENFCWVRHQTNNQIQRLPSSYFCRSKVTLLIFRREGDLEIRHQRSPDSMFDFVKPKMPGDLNDRKPDFAYTAIETLLPRALCTDEEPEPNRLLQLWFPSDCHRTNWTAIMQKPVV
ncbi:hypothetical protein IW140_000739 [Coemansia sp. RSA 1813]|nr:hypothetical protein EV178_000755 [Coemansia sp. RSA 1646]KAJ1773608.1 hypothetical protein LPJ74_000524 [Coemansia sp. RSA 1843]KAJ2092376.1 hypothetical protein IW138_001138 [Coemansia sp. RSA 986]KAJ2217398.1 hypothetical protein EV179_000548 [Coemansia sp. RSA 487]KAJ2572624.1 hypothetical protein IW140_000739 [Coemansia sp. RSA 1813]